MPTFKEQLEKLTELQHRLAVWETLHDFLEENFTAKDGTPAKKAIKAPGSHREVVPEEIIEDILQSIGENDIEDLKKEIAEVEGYDPDAETEEPAQGGAN